MTGRIAVGLGLLAALAACSGSRGLTDEQKLARIHELYAEYRSSFKGLPEMTIEQLVSSPRDEESVVLVDVRTEDERAVSVIPGSISQEEFEARPAELEGRKVVTYCTIGYRSGLYAETLRRQGWDAYNLPGSILAWTHAGGALESEGEGTRRLHVFDSRWDLAAEGYEAVW